MMRKWMNVLVGLVFLCSVIFLITSCQKTVSTETSKVEKPKDYDPHAESKRMIAEQRRKEQEAFEKEMARRRAMKKTPSPPAKPSVDTSAFEARHIYFDFDRAELKPESRDILKAKAAWLKANPDFSVRIEGHCDERGTNEYNIALGERRANAAWKYLNALGISGDRIDTVSYGEERPIDPGHNEAAWRKNRRDQFKLMR